VPERIETVTNLGSSKMLKKVTTDFKAAIILIVTENVAALRMFSRNFTKSIFKTAPKRRNAKQQDKKTSMARKET
jgi:hypothetical protein